MSIPTSDVEHYSRAEFLVVAGSSCPDIYEIVSYAHDFRDYRGYKDRVSSLRSLADTLESARARASSLTEADAPADLVREYKRTVLASLADMVSAARKMRNEYIVAGHETVTFLRAIRSFERSARSFSAFGKRHRLAECHA